MIRPPGSPVPRRHSLQTCATAWDLLGIYQKVWISILLQFYSSTNGIDAGMTTLALDRRNVQSGTLGICAGIGRSALHPEGRWSESDAAHSVTPSRERRRRRDEDLNAAS